jgi:hypothetical protein
MADETPEGIALPLVWMDLDDADTQAVNQLIVQHHEDEFILTFGHLTPPMLIGTPEETAAQARTIPYVAVKVVARMAATPAKVEAFVKAMQTVLDGYQELQRRKTG